MLPRLPLCTTTQTKPFYEDRYNGTFHRRVGGVPVIDKNTTAFLQRVPDDETVRKFMAAEGGLHASRSASDR